MKETENKQQEVSGEKEELGGKKGGRSRLKRVAVVLLFVAVIGVVLGYAARNWLIEETEKLVVVALAEAGVHLGYEKSERVPLRGMVFENLAIYSSEKKEVPLMVISDIAIFPSLGRWLIERRISVRVTLYDSEIKMLVDGKEVEKVENVNAWIKAGVGGVEVKRLTAQMNGADFDLTGQVMFGKKKGQKGGDVVDKAIDAVKKGPLIDFAFWQDIQQWIELKSAAGQVQIRGDFDIDTGNLAEMTVKADFSGESFAWHGMDFDQLRAQVLYDAKGKVVEVSELDVLSKEGKMTGDFSYHFVTKVLEVSKLDGQTDVLSLINDYLGSAVVNEKVFVMVKPPHLGMSGTLDFGDLRKSNMKVEFLPADEVAMKVAGELISMKELTGAVLFAEGKVSVVQPDVFAKMNEGEFHLGGYLQLLSEDSGQGNQMSADFTLKGKSIDWHGLVLDHANSEVIYSGKDQLVDFKKVDVAYDGKPLSGELRYRITDKTIEMVKVESQIDFVKLIKDLLANEGAAKMPDVALLQAPHLQVDGLVNFGDLKQSDVQVKFLNEKDVVVKTGGRRVEMKAVKGALAFAGGAVSTVEPGLTMRMADGGVSLRAKMEVLSEQRAYQASLKLEDVSLAELKSLASGGEAKGEAELKGEDKEPVKGTGKGAKEVTQKELKAETQKGDEGKKEVTEESEKEQKPVNEVAEGEKKATEQKKEGDATALRGRLFFEFDGAGDAGAMVRQGKGSVRIEEAEFYTMPLLGTFFDTFNKIIPAFGRRKDGETHGTQKLTGTYQIKDAIIRSEDLHIQGDLSEVVVKVFYDVEKDNADIDGKINFTGAMGVVTGLASKLLEIEGTGPIKNMKWGLKGLNGHAGGGEGVINAGGNAVKGAAAMTGKGAEKLIEGAGKIGEGLKNVLFLGKGKKDKKEEGGKKDGKVEPAVDESATKSGERAANESEKMKEEKTEEAEEPSKGLKKLLPFGKKKKKSE
ncbi:MAG: hypothetical protein L3J39_05770 [Verrucomicrobiales bacterium]|nr:hypothetical protein [Verrucomicrobiales bacterium]